MVHGFGGPGSRDFEVGGGAEDLGDVLQRVGKELFEGVFQGRVGSQLTAVVGRGRRPKKLLRLLIRLPLDETGHGVLQELPWEALWSRRNGDFLALEPCYSIVRHIQVPAAAELPPKPERLRVLALAVDGGEELAPLRLEREAKALRKAFEGSSEVDVDVEEAVSLPELAHLLEDRRPHVLHLMGHGGFDAARGEGFVYLPAAGGGVERVRGEQLAAALKSATWRSDDGRDEAGPGLQLVVLNACRTACSAAAAPFAGVATALVRQGDVPAVLAMQYPIHDDMATRFSAELYRRLAANTPLEEALFQARLRVRETGSLDWVAPALFSRLPGGRLFQEEAVPLPTPVDPPAAPWTDRLRAAGLILLAVGAVALAVVLPRGGLPWSPFGAALDGGQEVVEESDASEIPGGAPLHADPEIPGEPRAGIVGEEPGGAQEQTLDPAPTEPGSGAASTPGSGPSEGDGGGSGMPEDPEVVHDEPPPAEPVPLRRMPPPPRTVREGESIPVGDGYLTIRFNPDLGPHLLTLDHTTADLPYSAMQSDTVRIQTRGGEVAVKVLSTDFAARQAELAILK